MILKLTIDLVPETAHFKSLYRYYQNKSELVKWKHLKERLFREEGHKCWICGKGGEGVKIPPKLDAHEFWNYRPDGVQELVAVHHICDLCHRIKHIGLWTRIDYGIEEMEKIGLTKNRLIEHFCKVNGCTAEDFNRHEEESFELYEKRSEIEWVQDFSRFLNID
ncbi:MAG: hypothetical protein HPY53_01195 [Brevinematales bacterium]|nr:hypothetical protein [Brevinematales bacterium]